MQCQYYYRDLAQATWPDTRVALPLLRYWYILKRYVWYASVFGPLGLARRIIRYAGVLGELRDTVALWRAARGVPEDDPRPTGPAVTDPIAARFQRHLLRQLTGRYSDSVRRWHEMIIHRAGVPVENDDTRGEAVELARELDTLQRHGHDARSLLDRAFARGPLPKSHAIAALTYRVRNLARLNPLLSRRESATHDASRLGL